MFVNVTALKCALSVSPWSCGHFLKLTDSILFEYHGKSSPLNSTHYIALYPQNDDRIVAIDSVTSLHPMYNFNRGGGADIGVGCVTSLLRRCARWIVCRQPGDVMRSALSLARFRKCIHCCHLIVDVAVARTAWGGRGATLHRTSYEVHRLRYPEPRDRLAGRNVSEMTRFARRVWRKTFCSVL